ncbi:MAG: DUF4185 domain-containing protein [Bacilli bacterium]|jgi:hypothetical protein
MKKKYRILLPLLALCLVGCDKQAYRPNDYEMFADLPVYSDVIKSVEYAAMVTGVNAPTDTKKDWKIGGTDLGFPYYDTKTKNMFYLFGDTFGDAPRGSGLWRSNVLGYSKDFDFSDGLSFDGFITDKNGMAKEIIPSPKDPNGVGGERTAIPTGGISIDGTHYVFWMSITEWLSSGWDVNLCACYKSTDDGKTFTEVENLYWVGSTRAKRAYAEDRLETTLEETANHISNDFMQVNPYRVGDLVYIIGITGGRFGGAKLGRVAVNDIEDFTKYEYYTGKDNDGKPVWIQGTAGLEALVDNEASYVVEPTVAEPCLSYSTYFGKHMLSYYTRDKIVFRLSDNLIDWSEYVAICSSANFVQLYGGFTHQMLSDKRGKNQYFLVSQFYVDKLGDNQYNVKLIKVTYK